MPLVCSENSSGASIGFEGTSSPINHQSLLLKWNNDSAATLIGDFGSSGEQNASRGGESFIQSPLAIVDSRFIAWATNEAALQFRGAPQEWLLLTVSSTSESLPCSEESTSGIGSRDRLALELSFIELPSEASKYSYHIDQPPSLGRDIACIVEESPKRKQTYSGSLSRRSSSSDDVSTAEDELTTPGTSPDWAAELVRVRLGTELPFKFLSILDADEEGATTKVALTTAILTFIATEGEMLDLLAVPPSYNSTSVLVSKIVPHTTVPGTTSLATFLEQSDFSEGDSVEAEKINRVFKDPYKEEARKRLLATTGIISTIGRRLDKLSSA